VNTSMHTLAAPALRSTFSTVMDFLFAAHVYTVAFMCPQHSLSARQRGELGHEYLPSRVIDGFVLRPARISAQAQLLAPAPVLALAPYSSAAARLLVDWKERGDVNAAAVMRLIMARAFADMRCANAPLGAPLQASCNVARGLRVVPVPPHWRTRIARAGDPLTDLAETSGVDIIPALRRGPSRDQVGLSQRERMINADRGFSLNRRVVPDGEAVFVVDDVVTTGATVVNCGQLLTSGGWRVGALVALFAKRFD
jgi:predicted amidophosphoribosyltransferase